MQAKVSIGRALRMVSIAALLVSAAATSVVDAAPAAQKDGASKKSVAPVNINEASKAELATVPGIGPVIAERIVQFREEHGPFKRVEDILKVRGIGEKSLQKLRPYLTVGKKR